jgi:polyvinyl alcohol dehydrogenase (cytochrome)
VTSSVDGRLRVFDTATGKLLFDYDTLRDFDKTVNGVPGKGGQIDHAAFVAGDGMLFVQSGYGQVPGNVLLAFRPRR